MENSLPADEVAGSSVSRKYRGFAIRIGLGLVIVGFLLHHYDARPALRSLARERPIFFAAAIALYVTGQLLCAWRWQLLAGVIHISGSFAEFLRFTFIAIFTNLFVPGLVGGDAARAFYLGRRHGRIGEAVASALADRAYGLMGLFWLAALVAITMNHGTLTPDVILAVSTLGGVAVAGYLAGPLIARIVPITGVLASMPLTLNGLGLRETAYLFLFGMAGVGRDDAIALGLLYFLATMIGGLFGAIAFMTTEVPPLSATPELSVKDAV